MNAIYRWSGYLHLFILMLVIPFQILAQANDTIILGQGYHPGVTVSTSSQTAESPAENTLNEAGFLPNLNKASRFLSQATLGYNYEEIVAVTDMGIEDWIDSQYTIIQTDTLLKNVRALVQTYRDSTKNPEANGTNRQWKYAWWDYHMSNQDHLRQRIALALSEILVISEKSSFGGNPYALADYYDIFLRHAFGNYRDILNDVTLHASMGVYLTYLNNPKTDTSTNRFPDENYAREIMQLFTLGLYELNNDGTRKLDSLDQFISTYDNTDIAEFAKVFTGFSWADRDDFGKRARKDTSYIPDMIMFDSWHEPGPKYLLNGFVVPDRNPVDGLADVQDALDNLFEHPNVGPFICKLLIQRLVTSNPPADYVDRVATVFNDNGQGVRGDMKSIIKAILLDPYANDCEAIDNFDFGMLREPFVRYMQINKAFDASTISGVYRNDMQTVETLVEQSPLFSPSVFNFFQADYQPLGPINDANLVAPEFQITDAQTIAGYINAVYEWIVRDNIADEYDLFGGEDDAGYADERSFIDLGDETVYTDDNELHILLDRLNLILAQGRLSDLTENTIIETLKEFPNNTAEQQEDRVRLAIYLVVSAPEYLINR